MQTILHSTKYCLLLFLKEEGAHIFKILNISVRGKLQINNPCISILAHGRPVMRKEATLINCPDVDFCYVYIFITFKTFTLLFSPENGKIVDIIIPQKLQQQKSPKIFFSKKNNCFFLDMNFE
jgi:hypothetical protein